MAIDKGLKAQIRLEYETTNTKLQDLASKYNVAYRTLAHWIQYEGWECNKAAAIIETKDIKNDITKKRFGQIETIMREKIESKIASECGYIKDIDYIIQKKALNRISENLLLKSISINMIQEDILTCALLAKDELDKMTALRNEEKADPMYLACLEKAQGLYINALNAIYGKESHKINNTININEYENLDTSELLKKLKSE